MSTDDPAGESLRMALVHQAEYEQLAASRNVPKTPATTDRERADRFHHGAMAENNALLAIAVYLSDIRNLLQPHDAQTGVTGVRDPGQACSGCPSCSPAQPGDVRDMTLRAIDAMHQPVADPEDRPRVQWCSCTGEGNLYYEYGDCDNRAAQIKALDAQTGDTDRPFYQDSVTGEPCVRRGPVLCHNTDRNHLHRAIIEDDQTGRLS